MSNSPFIKKFNYIVRLCCYLVQQGRGVVVCLSSVLSVCAGSANLCRGPEPELEAPPTPSPLFPPSLPLLFTTSLQPLVAVPRLSGVQTRLGPPVRCVSPWLRAQLCPNALGAWPAWCAWPWLLGPSLTIT